MNEKIKRFEKALEKTANNRLIDFWNDLDKDLQSREQYIEEIESVNMQLQLHNNDVKLKLHNDLLKQSYENMKMIAYLNLQFANRKSKI